MKKPTLAQDRIGAHLWSFNFASKLIHGGRQRQWKRTRSTAPLRRPGRAVQPALARSEVLLAQPRIRKMFA
jgi:hypothetical protein